MKARTRRLAAALAVLVAVTAAPVTPASAETPAGTPAGLPAKTPAESPATDSTPVAQRDALLGDGWRTSTDRLWTTAGDATGLHLLVAEERTGYTWRTVASLSRPGVETDRWIGNACVTGSGRRAVVVFAPRAFTNRAQLTARGGFTAVVDLISGVVRHLPVRTSLAYFNPGCGADETVALTQEGDEDLGRTGLSTVDATTGRLSRRVELRGQFTSAVPAGAGFVVAADRGLVRVDAGGRTAWLAASRGVATQLRPLADGTVAFVDARGDAGRVARSAPVGDAVTRGRIPLASTIATGPRTRIAVHAGAGGRAYVTGEGVRAGALPAMVSRLDVPRDVRVSTTGRAAVTDVAEAGALMADRPQPLRIDATAVASGRRLTFAVDPGAALRPRDQDMTDAAATCALRRNDTLKQVYQPKPKQVEWAANQAVKGVLTVRREADWHHNGIGEYTPQGMFPPVPLRNTTNGKVPAQVLLGILGQESNLWQASRHLYPGDYGNPLVGNFYGLEIYNDVLGDDWDIRWDKADCGYGVSQMTDGMRARGRERPGETALPWEQQVAIATDYAANLAAGLRLLQTKWNQLQDAGMRVNDNNPAKPENWFLAVWAYNSGYHQPGEAGANGAYGLGWLNNPGNPRYDANRHPFGSNPRDFATPQRWPYPEKVMGFGAYPPSGFENPGTEVPFFRAAWWNGAAGPAETPGTANYNRATGVLPPVYAFCEDAKNNCYREVWVTPNAPEVVGEPAGPCHHVNAAGQYDLKCWWHDSVVTKNNCPATCGNEFIRYDPGLPEPDDGISNPPTCGDADLPPDALVVDDVGRDTEPVRQYCPRSNFADGTFSMAFGRDGGGFEPGRIDLHQSSGGYGGHHWFSTTKGVDAEGRKLEITATWTLGNRLTTPAQVWVFYPSMMGDTRRPITYTIHTGAGPVTRTVGWQGVGPRWVNLGTYAFNNQPAVSLSTTNGEGTGERLTFDAVAFVAQTGDTWPTERVVSLLHDHSGRCLAFQGDSTAVGAPAVQRPCDDGFGENWFVSLLGTHNEVVDGNRVTIYQHRIRNRNSGLCLGIRGAGVDHGDVAEQQPCTGSGEQQWWSRNNQAVPQAPHLEAFQNGWSEMYLGVQGCSLVNGAPVVQLGDVGDRDCSTLTSSWKWDVAGLREGG